MTIVRRSAPRRNFTTFDNDLLEDARISFRASGLLTYLLSKPENWRVDAVELTRGEGKGEGREGRDAIRSALNELEGAGYLVREKHRDARGRWVTEAVVYDKPYGARMESGSTTEIQSLVRPAETHDSETEEQVGPETGFPTTGFPTVGNPVPNTNTGIRTFSRDEDSDFQPDPVENCTVCENAGWVEVTEDNVVVSRRCVCGRTSPSPLTPFDAARRALGGGRDEMSGRSREARSDDSTAFVGPVQLPLPDPAMRDATNDVVARAQ